MPGTYILEPSVLARIPEGGRVSIERETFPAMVRDGGLFALSDEGYWLDTGTPAAFLAGELRPTSPVVGAGPLAPGLDGPGRAPPRGARANLRATWWGRSVIFSGCGWRPAPGSSVACSGEAHVIDPEPSSVEAA